jgi:uncharacterized protein (DUF1330 family)
MSIRNSLICMTLLMAMVSACATTAPKKDGGVYAILELTVHDEQTYEQYRQKVKPIIEKLGGKYVVRAGRKFVSDNPTSRLLNTSGDWNPDRIIVLHFDSAEQFQTFLDDPEYKEIVHLRTSSSSMKSILVEAFRPNE